MRVLKIIFLFLPFYSIAQTDSITGSSGLEKMTMQAGSFVNITTDTLGSTNDLHVGILTATDLNSGKKQRSVCFIAANGFNSIGFSATNVQIDIEDLYSFTNALEKMKEIADSKIPAPFQQYQFVSSNLTVLKMENRLNKSGKWDLIIYKRFKNLNNEVPGSLLLIKEKNIGDLVVLLKRYKTLLGDALYK